MSRETDGIRAIPVAAGVPHVVTDLNTPGSHTPYDPRKNKYGSHYQPATLAPPIEFDHSRGDVGGAVDFAHRRYDGRSDSPELLAIWKAFVPLAMAGKLQELFYAGPGADYCVYGGKWQRWSDLPTSVRNAIRATHHNHVHVSVRKGVYLAPAPPKAAAAAVLTKEQAMSMVIEPVGVVAHPQEAGGWAFGRRGHVYALPGTAFDTGAGWDEATRADPTRWCVALVPARDGFGYWLVSNRGEIYAYRSAVGIPSYKAEWGPGVIIGAFVNHRRANGGVTLVRDDGSHLNEYRLPE